MKINLNMIRNIAKDIGKKKVLSRNVLHIQASMYPFLKENGMYLENLDAYQTANIIANVNEWRTLHIKKKNIENGTDTYKPYRYYARDIILVRLGSTNIGYEPSYNHPAIVLNQGYNWVMIAPCSTGRFGKGINEIVDAYASTDGVKFNTGIQADKIRVVDKWRIINRVGRLSRTKYEELTNKIIELHFNYHWNVIKESEKKINYLVSENESLKHDIAEKDSKLEEFEKMTSHVQEEAAATKESE